MAAFSFLPSLSPAANPVLLFELLLLAGLIVKEAWVFVEIELGAADAGA